MAALHIYLLIENQKYDQRTRVARAAGWIKNLAKEKGYAE
jgi:hypothetical protein